MSSSNPALNQLVLVVFTNDPRVVEAQGRRSPPPEVLQAKTPAEVLNLLRARSPNALIYDADGVATQAIEVDKLLPQVKRDHPGVTVVAYSHAGGNEDLMTQHVALRLAHTSVDASASDSQWVNTLEGLLDDGDAFVVCREVPRHKRPMVGSSPKMKALAKVVAKLAPPQTTIHIFGETGTGKEVVARQLHALNPDTANLPFVSLSVTELVESGGGVAEAQLFGKEKGAFTGAEETTPGVFEAARGGTVFLDEIGELPLILQGKLLRVLEEQDVMRVGGTQRIPVRFRLITGTHRDLRELVKEGKFREDLYYRLVVAVIETPPLRERREDLPKLVEHFARIKSPVGYPVRRFSQKILERLARYSFPGNVRELENIVETLIARVGIGRAVIISRDLNGIRGFEVPDESHDEEYVEENTIVEPLAVYMARTEQAYLEKVLRVTRSNRSKAANLLQIDRKTLYEKLKRYGMDHYL